MGVATNEPPPSQPSLTLATNRARARAALGINEFTDVAEFFNDLDEGAASGAIQGNWAAVVASGGTLETPTQPTFGSGVVRLRSNTTASGAYTISPQRNPINSVVASKFYVAWRFQLGNTAPADVLAAVGVGVRDNFVTAKTISVGMFKAFSTTNFALQYDGVMTGSALSLGVALDTLPHVGEIWGNGSTTINGRLDGGANAAAVSAVMAAASTTAAHSPAAFAGNGGSTTDRDLFLDWVYMMAVRL